MKVHHLNALTMCPRLGRALNESGRLVAHCLVVETNAGLVVVDTGVGLDGIARRAQMLAAPFRALVRPRLDPAETIVRQLEALGFSARDVRHIVVTHLDMDHAGGLSDFPDATVHIFADEHDAAMKRATFFERERYITAQWAHGPKWAPAPLAGDTWLGFDAVRQLPGLPPEILLVPLAGHSRGHSGVAVDVGGRWLLHCGDAYFYRGELDVERPHCTRGFSVMEGILAFDDVLRLKNRDRLLALKRANRDVTLFSAHDPDELAALQAQPS